MSDNEIKILLAAIAAAAAIVGTAVSYVAGKSTRRRTVYGEALKTVVAWTEMPHRVRRREPGEDPALRERFHLLQEDLACHRGLIGSESKYVERSYARLVKAAKDASKERINLAWDGGTVDGEENPDLSADVLAFLQDVRAHLSPWPWRKVSLWWRNKGRS